MKFSFDLRTHTGVYRAVAVLCVFLIFLTGFIAAVHFHADGSDSSDRSCSVCALAHAGVVPAEIGTQIPVLVPTVVSEVAAEKSHSLLLVSSSYIRPPPQA
jgi:hypothetical protein